MTAQAASAIERQAQVSPQIQVWAHLSAQATTHAGEDFGGLLTHSILAPPSGSVVQEAQKLDLSRELLAGW